MTEPKAPGPRPSRIAGVLRKAGDLWRRLDAAAGEYYAAPYRSAIARAKRDRDDLFMLMVYSEAMGIPNPASYYTLELQPFMLSQFHDWHRRMGMDRSPLDHFRCC